jgi:acyl dehydratase
VSHTLTLTDLVRYAGASGDLHPLHHDAEAAQAMGLAGVIGHGMFSAGLLTRAITDFVGVATIRDLTFRFLSPTRPGEELHTSVHVVSTAGSGADTVVDLACSLTSTAGDVKVTASARAARPAQGL